MAKNYNLNEHDNSKRLPVETNNADTNIRSLAPIFSGKGISNVCVKINNSADFEKEFGKQDLKMHGQQGIQIIESLKHGGTTFVCRLMPDNATMASTVFGVNVATGTGTAFLKDVNGDYILDADGEKQIEMETDGITPKTTEYVFIKWATKEAEIGYGNGTTSSMDSFEFIALNNESDFTLDAVEYTPIFIFSHNALGECGNKVAININVGNGNKKREKYVTYNFDAIYQDDVYGNYSLITHVVSSGKAIEFSIGEATLNKNSTTSIQFNDLWTNKHTPYDKNDILNSKIQAFMYSTNYEDVLAKIETLNPDINIYNSDIVFGLKRDGKEDPNFSFDDSSFMFSDYRDGWIALTGGTNGALTKPTTPTEVDAYRETQNSLLVKFFSYGVDKRLADVTRLDPRFIFDANYNMDVKKSILNLVSEREEIFAFLDTNLSKDVTSIINAGLTIKSNISDITMSNGAIYGGACIPLSGKGIFSITYELASKIYDIYKTRLFFGFTGSIFGQAINIREYYTPPTTTSNANDSMDESIQYDDNGINYYRSSEEINAMSTIKSNKNAAKIYLDNLDTIYPEESSLTQVTNAIILCDIKALIKKTSQKYVNSSNASDTKVAIETSLNKKIGDRYSSKILPSWSVKVEQTNEDVENNAVTVVYNLLFANAIEYINNDIYITRK